MNDINPRMTRHELGFFSDEEIRNGINRTQAEMNKMSLTDDSLVVSDFLNMAEQILIDRGYRR